MTSEPRPAPFRVPDRLFAELAAGGGSAEAVAFLERGERARRLLLLRTLLDRLAELPTPLTPVADAWNTFKEAAERAPEAVDRLLLAPTTGGWIAHMLRRVHGTATGPPLWAEAGRLNVLAITAALHAGTDTSLTVPLTDGALQLPELGLLRLPATPPGPTVARATTRSGELTLSGPPAHAASHPTVTCRPTTAPARGRGAGELRAEGPRPEGPRPEGPRPEGPRPAGLRPAGPRPGGFRPEGPRPDGSPPDPPAAPASVGAAASGAVSASGAPASAATPASGAAPAAGAAPSSVAAPASGPPASGPPTSASAPAAGAASSSVGAPVSGSAPASAPVWASAPPFEAASAAEAAPSSVAAPAAGAAPAPAPVEAPAPWLPLRTLTHATPAGPVAIPLDDLDPYRDLDDPVPPARLDDDEAAEWQRVFDDAVAILAGAGDGQGPGRLDPALIRAVVPCGRTALTPPAPPAVAVSASSGDSFGAMLISRPGSALALAETLVHEFQHSKLAALLHLFPLLDDDREERFYAPWRADPRHLTGLLHGAYAFTGVTGFWRDRLAEPEHAEAAAYHFALRRLQSRLVVRTLLTSARLTAPGRRLVEGLARTLDGWLRVPVDPAARSRARTAASLHRTQWRLRNLAAPVGPDGILRFRPDRGFWPDSRTHAFANRPAAPRTPDEHLAAGDPATALDGYAKDLARDPADPRALSGWIVARATLDPGHATRRPLARPELLQPRPGG
ncbi:HEXXH motif-containing putative peptide modification protein [Streptomyces sp. BB1-1-1]|uniref:aKG-HExxH-type peptide beta-hydroxylase n=1 Tax=Streptomyces sp. BB1-1-1 TaxID=3074430 RepID=UPI002878066A|nr:HEXXH motif-containing putative peptide modification protein [Streptomyces sp. BB1-1-1]WND34404.1 HEXXH motif-containing putative peptide modification protein [Streptomyces sp. BB1-1-1]